MLKINPKDLREKHLDMVKTGKVGSSAMFCNHHVGYYTLQSLEVNLFTWCKIFFTNMNILVSYLLHASHMVWWLY